MTWIAAGIASGAATHAAVQYFHNKKKAKDDAKNRPAYQIPPEVAAGLNEAQRQALQGLPEEQKAQYISNLQRGSAYSLSQAGSRKAGLQGISTLNENQNVGYANLLVQDSAARMNNQKQVFNQLENVANYKGQSFQLNQLNPYYETIKRRMANEGALSKSLSNAGNMVGGMGGIGNGGGSKSGTPNESSALQQNTYYQIPSNNQTGMYNYKSAGGGYSPQNDPLNGNYNAPDMYPDIS